MHPLAHDGMVRSASGRITYAPDGIVSDGGQEEYEEKAAFEPIRSSPSDTDETMHEPNEDMEVTRWKSVASIDPADLEQLKRIATRDRDMNRVDTLALKDDDTTLDPSHKDFDLYKWARRFLHEFDEQGLRSVRSGIVFKNLSVSGSGSALQLQQTVFSMLLAPFRNFSFGKKPHKQILNKFDGLLDSGELLIVLGRPGSGCSTFLKSLCGETHGLNIDSGSTIHYNGMCF